MAALAHVPHGLDRAGFIAKFGDVYPYNPWVAAAAFDSGAMDGTLDGLAAALRAVVDAAPEAAQLTLIQAQAGCVATWRETVSWSEAETQAFEKLMGAYSVRFGIPFVIDGDEMAATAILEQCALRMGNSRRAELGVALDHLHRMAAKRLRALLSGG